MRFAMLYVCLVCVFDIYCTVKYADTLPLLEQNMIARSLISHNGEPIYDGDIMPDYSGTDVSKLIAFKCLGLLAARDILEWMIRKNTRWSRAVIYSIASIQTVLLFYLVV